MLMDIPPDAGKSQHPGLAAQPQPSSKKKPHRPAGKKKGKKVSKSESPKRTESGSSIGSSSSSTGDSPLVTRRSREHFRQLKDIEHFPELTPEHVVFHRTGAIKSALEIIASEKKTTLETAYVMTSCLCQLYRSEEAKPYAEALMKLAPPGHPHHPLACLWMGITLYQMEELYNEEIMGLLNTAHHAGIPLAAKYMMHAYSGINGTLSEVKWTNPKAFLKIACKFKQQKDRHYVTLRKAMPSNPLALPLKEQMFHDYRIQTEVKEMVVTEEVIHEFNKLICELMVAPRGQIKSLSQTIRSKIEKFAEERFTNQILPILYLYALGSRETNNTDVLDELSEIPHCMAGFCASELLKQRTPFPTQQQFELLTESRGLMDAYQYQADMLIAREAFAQAIEVYRTGIDHLNGYLDKKLPLLHRTSGQQSETLRVNQYPERFEDEVELEEQDCIHQKILFFQEQIELIEEALLEEKRAIVKKLSATKELSEAESSDESDSEYFDALESLSLKECEDEVTPEPPEQTDLEGFQQVPLRKKTSGEKRVDAPLKLWPPASHVPEQSDAWYELSAMNRANNLAKIEKQYEQAEAQLKRLHYKSGSYLWFVQQDSLCWLDFLRATDTEFLVAHAGKGATRTLAKKILEQTEEKVFKQINALAAMTNVTTQHETVERDEKKCLKIADTLEETDPRLRKQYGGLYSKLGHLHKAMKDISRNGKEFTQHARAGKQYYLLANAIRRRPNPDSAMSQLL